jgi:Protein of unknown function (DUF3396)
MAWHDDPIFKGNPSDPFRLETFASPAFRLSMLASFDQAHPFAYLEAYRTLFDVLRPCLERRAERLLMIEKPGAAARRRKTITPADWDPFGHMASVIPADDGHFIGFQFQSGFRDLGTGDAGENIYDAGPALFRFWVGSIIDLDATISVDDWNSGMLDVERLKAAILQIPASTALAGFGLALSDLADNSAAVRHQRNLVAVADKYPALDVSHNGRRRWFADYERDLAGYWLAGINWLTFLGEPFLSSLGGADKVTSGLPPAIEVSRSAQGVLFQLGQSPIAGEAGADDLLLSLYRALGEKLKPKAGGHPSKKNPRHPVFGEPYKAESLAWERRFYDAT